MPYVPPHVNASRNGASTNDLRYSKDKFLELFRTEQEAGNLLESLDALYIGGFYPSASNGVAGATWGRRDEHKENHSVELCWDRNARMFPKALQDLTDEERDVRHCIYYIGYMRLIFTAFQRLCQFAHKTANPEQPGEDTKGWWFAS